MPIADTSRDAMDKLLTISHKQHQVMTMIFKYGPISDRQIASKLGWPINSVTPRRGELQALTLIRCAGQRQNENKRFEMVWERGV